MLQQDCFSSTCERMPVCDRQTRGGRNKDTDAAMCVQNGERVQPSVLRAAVSAHATLTPGAFEIPISVQQRLCTFGLQILHEIYIKMFSHVRPN